MSDVAAAAKRDREARENRPRRYPPISAGDTVRAFHPHTLGVVKYGRVVSVGRKYARVDFGALNGSVVRVRLIDVLEHVS